MRTWVQRFRRGQALTEFMVMLAMMLSVIVLLVLFMAVFTEWGWRVLHLIGMEYP